MRAYTLHNMYIFYFETFCTLNTIRYVIVGFQKSHSVHVSSCNGDNLGSKYVAAQVTGITTIGDCLVVVDDAGDLTLSRLLG